MTNQNDIPGSIDISTLDKDPISQFQRWMVDAQSAGINMPEAMVLSTTSKEGKPSSRMVLLKGIDMNGFVFFTNYGSRKSRELLVTPYAALLFHWNNLERQVRIEGTAEKISAKESDAYFSTRPRESQISAVISPQSAIVSGREELQELWNEAKEMYEGKEIPRPEFWGGFRVKPLRIEFWQGRPGRLHDRILYQRQKDGTWSKKRLAP